MLKYLQYYEGGITAGYFTNPNLENIPYGSSLSSSSSSIFTQDVLSLLNTKGYDALNKDYYYTLVVARTQSFYCPNDLIRPLEYKVIPVEEKFNIYFDKVYDSNDNMDPADLDVFIDISLKIFEKYKIHWNQNNKKLLLITNESDANFSKYTHGGYECGDDSL